MKLTLWTILVVFSVGYGSMVHAEEPPLHGTQPQPSPGQQQPNMPGQQQPDMAQPQPLYGQQQHEYVPQRPTDIQGLAIDAIRDGRDFPPEVMEECGVPRAAVATAIPKMGVNAWKGMTMLLPYLSTIEGKRKEITDHAFKLADEERRKNAPTSLKEAAAVMNDHSCRVDALNDFERAAKRAIAEVLNQSLNANATEKAYLGARDALAKLSAEELRKLKAIYEEEWVRRNPEKRMDSKEQKIAALAALMDALDGQKAIAPGEKWSVQEKHLVLANVKDAILQKEADQKEADRKAARALESDREDDIPF